MTATISAAPTKEALRSVEPTRAPEPESSYRGNLRDIKFNLFEVFGRGRILGRGPFRKIDREQTESLLGEADNLARESFGRSYVLGDRNPPTLSDGVIHISDELRRDFNDYMASGYYLAGLPAELGGVNAPRSVARALSMPFLRENAPLYFYTLGPELAGVLYEMGNDAQEESQQKIAHVLAKQIIEGNYGAAMDITEADAGSDVGAITTVAVKKKDGSWHIKGTKRFITSGEHDLTDNIIHTVLARTVDEDGNTLPGTGGLGFFVVSKNHIDPETGEMIIRDKQPVRNGVKAVGIADKMGIKASATVELAFGDDDENPAVGYLLGDSHRGIKQMFRIIENARMMIGIKSMETLSRAHQDALEYAKVRVQGVDLVEAEDRNAEKVTITHHANVRDKLSLLGAYANGLRALDFYATTFQDAMQIAKEEGNEEELKRASAINDLLLPVVKGFGSERTNQLVPLALDVAGGSGFMRDYPYEQYVRDAKIDTIYEGTTAIQSLDFIFRKYLKDRGQALRHVLAEVDGFVGNFRGKAKTIFQKGLRRDSEMVDEEVTEDGPNGLKQERRMLARALRNFRAMEYRMRWTAFKSRKDKTERYKLAHNSQRFMEAFGDVVVGYLLLRQAELALTQVDAATGDEKAFYQGKIDAARYFVRNVLPRLAGDRKIIKNNLDTGDYNLMNVAETSL